MNKKFIKLNIFVVLIIVFAFALPAAAQAETPDPLLGDWYASFETGAGFGGNFRFEILTDGLNYSAIMYIPDLGIFYEEWPVEISGDTIIFGGFLVGTIAESTIHGNQILPVPYEPYFDQVSWEAFRLVPQEIDIDPGPGSECPNLPQLYCTGSAEYCSELVPFDPDYGAGYIDFPVNGETWENQYRSYLRRDLKQAIDYATAKLQCKTGDWEFGNSASLGLADMSEADGSIPGTSVGSPGHPPGTHTNGKDIDVAYYQFHTPDNRSRIICAHHELDNTYGVVDAYHCTSDPYMLDPWRTALFTAYLAEHPFLRVMGVDGKVGPLLDDSLDWFSSNGWIDQGFRSTIPLFYEETDQGYGFYKFHHHHMHVSMNPVEPILLSLQIEPETLNLTSKGKYITAYIELVDGVDPGQIDLQTVSITVDGFTTLSANPEIFEIGDFDKDDIPDLMVKFDRQALHAMLSDGWQEITIFGAVNWDIFQGVDQIKVISSRNK